MKTQLIPVTVQELKKGDWIFYPILDELVKIKSVLETLGEIEIGYKIKGEIIYEDFDLGFVFSRLVSYSLPDSFK